MSARDPFPEYQPPSLSRDAVIEYLAASKGKGWCLAVYSQDGGFVIRLAEGKEVFVIPEAGA